MCNKIAIYVEGQTEQILITQLILQWWNFSEIRVENLKLVNDLKNPVQNFKPDKYNIYFLIINVEGMGSLTSAILERADKQIESGFRILVLRDLDYENSKKFPDAINALTYKFRKALNTKKCVHVEKIDLYFAVMCIEAWILGFPDVVAKWAKVSPDEVWGIIKKYSPNLNIEEIRNPATILEQISKENRKNTKSFKEISSIVSNIDLTAIQKCYESGKIASFNNFWDKLILLSKLV